MEMAQIHNQGWCKRHINGRYITPAVYGVRNASERGTKSAVTHKWVDWLHSPCRVEGSRRFRAGDKWALSFIISRKKLIFSVSFLRSRKQFIFLRHNLLRKKKFLLSKLTPPPFVIATQKYQINTVPTPTVA